MTSASSRIASRQLPTAPKTIRTGRNITDDGVISVFSRSCGKEGSIPLPFLPFFSDTGGLLKESVKCYFLM